MPPRAVCPLAFPCPVLRSPAFPTSWPSREILPIAGRQNKRAIAVTDRQWLARACPPEFGSNHGLVWLMIGYSRDQPTSMPVRTNPRPGSPALQGSWSVGSASGAKWSITKHGRPLTGRAINNASSAVSPVRATLPPSLRSKRKDHGPIERETLICGALDYGNERRSRAFLVRWLNGAMKQHNQAVDLLVGPAGLEPATRPL